MPDTLTEQQAVEGVLQVHPFEEMILEKANKDFQSAETFLSSYHRWCKKMHEFYHSASRYVNLRKKNEFPSTAIQEDVDLFMADARDKLFYGERPCRIVGREDSDKDDAQAKQELMDYQDKEDKIFSKYGKFIRDAALYRHCVAQVDYREKTRREWVQVDVPLQQLDEFGRPLLNPDGSFLPLIDEQGQVVTEKEWDLQDIPVYKGATVKRVDPMNFFFGPDKQEIDDEWPVMIRDRKSREFFDPTPSKRYFFNQEHLKQGEYGSPDDPAADKRADTTQAFDSSLSSRVHEYIEWQGVVDRRRLYLYLRDVGRIQEDQLRELDIIPPGEKTWAIFGWVDKTIPVQLRENPFKLDRPNISVGWLMPDEEGLMGLGLAQKIESFQRAEDDMLGILIENFKQSVNAFWIINTEGLVGAEQKVNEAGGTFKTNQNVNNVARRVEQPRVAPDIYALLELFKQGRQNAIGTQDSITGKGDRAVGTLGEASQVFAQAALRFADYLKEFEDTFVRPMYEMRNHINATLITEDYVFLIIGKEAESWRKIEPGTIRASVNFVCESASRETNRAIIIQQLLQMIKVASVVHQAGQVVRFDKIMAELAESGFSMSREKVREFFPLIRLEDENRQNETGIDIDELLMRGAIANMQLQAALAGVQGAGGNGSLPAGPGTGGPIPNPTSESAAINANQKRNQTQLTRV